MQCFSDSNKENQISNISKKTPVPLLNLAVILAFSPILSFEPCHQWIFFRKYPKYSPTFYWGFIGLNPLPLWKFQFTFMLSFQNFGLLENILRLLVMRISMLHYCKRLTIKIFEMDITGRYSQVSLRRTPLGPALSVRLREMSVL